MPHCGSQVILCDLPIRFDSYAGCAHACTYCFARAKRDLADVRPAESVVALSRWIAGARTVETNWCAWRPPLHFGGMSDPFQPAERVQRRSLTCLELLAETGYPVVISSKGRLVAERPYLDLVACCNAVVQVSMVAPAFDQLEPGAPRYRQRLSALRRLVPRARRVIVRVQPYVPDVLPAVLRALPRYAAVGVHGVIVEGLKCKRSAPGLVKVAGDWCFPADRLELDFQCIRDQCHHWDLRFYCAENRLRRLSDDRTCCGVDGVPGFRPNRANLNSLVFGRPLRYRRRMHEPGTAGCFKALIQSPLASVGLKRLSYADAMDLAASVPAYRAALGLPD